MAAALTPDLEAARRHLLLLDEDAAGFVFQTFDDSERKDPALARVLHGSLDQHAEELTRLQARGAGVFVTVNRSKNGGRKKGDISAYRAIWREADEPDLPPLPLAPHIIVETSPGHRHEYLLIEPFDDLSTGDSLMARMVADFGSCPGAKDRARVLRLAGFYHSKNPARPHMVKIIHEDGGLPYTLERVKKFIPPLARGRKEPPMGRTSKYGQAALASELSQLARASEGSRNNELNRASFSLGQLISGGELDRQQVEAGLLGTALAIGLTENEARATIRSGLDSGAREPRKAPNSEPSTAQTGGAAEAPFGSPADIGHWLDSTPPEIKEIFEGLLVEGVVGGLFAQGGTGKTYLMLCLMLSAALGTPFFRTFKPTRPMRVLGLLGEDPPEMIHRRVKSILGGFENVDKGLLADSLRLYCDRPSPLMKLNGNNPAWTEAFEWLKAEVEEFRPELVVVDPKSMFYGLDENSNDHCTQWVNTLKALTMNGATVLFSHHVTKALSGALELTGARGGSALVDGSRFAANMRHLTDDDAKKYDIDEPWRYVEFKVTKNSYVPKLPGSVFFRFTEGGALEEVNLQATREYFLVEDLLAALTAEAERGNLYTAREIERDGAVLPADLSQRERKEAVKLAMDSGRLTTETITGKGRPRVVLVSDKGLLANMAQEDCAEVII